MLMYSITSRKFWISGVEQPELGYAGHGTGLNNPKATNVKGVGPLPVGLYALSPWVDHPHMGPCVTFLKPVNVPNLYGRGDFFIHGDNHDMNFTASDGCIVIPASLRQRLRKSGETQLRVVE